MITHVDEEARHRDLSSLEAKIDVERKQLENRRDSDIEARMKKLDPYYSPVPEFALDNYYAQSDSLQTAANVEAFGRETEEGYVRLPKAAGL